MGESRPQVGVGARRYAILCWVLSSTNIEKNTDRFGGWMESIEGVGSGWRVSGVLGVVGSLGKGEVF